MVNEIYGGDKESCGQTMYGDADGAICALKAYKNWAIAEKKIEKNWNVVAPSSIHPMYKRACEIQNIEIKLCDVSYAGK